MSSLKAKIQRIDKSLPLPVYETRGAVGLDLVARENVLVQPGTIELIAGNVVIQVPKGYMLMIASRSSTPRKKGLMLPHGLGIIDQDYCGPDDEIKIQVYNFTSAPVEVKRGEKIAQAVFVRVDSFEWEEVDRMDQDSRGGFGSTD